jgi:hypothetical protein
MSDSDADVEWDEPFGSDRCVHCGRHTLDPPDADLWRKCSTCRYSIGPSHVSLTWLPPRGMG